MGNAGRSHGSTVAWFEITSPNPARLLEFYGKLYDWKAGDSGEPSYSLIDTGSGPDAIGGGIGMTQTPDDPGGVTIYVKADDLRAYLDKAEALGGRTLVPPTDLPEDFGTFAMLADPDGHPVGIWA